MINEVLEDLKAYTPLTDIIGTRIYRGKVPASVTPVYPLIFFDADRAMENTLSGESSLQHYIFNFEVHASSYVVTKNIRWQLMNALVSADNYKAVNTEVTDDRYNDETDQYMLTVNVFIWG